MKNQPPNTALADQPLESRNNFTLEDFNYQLPEELIAQFPSESRTGSRLLHIDAQGCAHDRQFIDLLSLLRPNDLLVFNDTKVIKARLHGVKESGGKVEVLVERVVGAHQALAHVRASKTPKPGTVLRLADSINVVVGQRSDDLFELEFEGDVLELLQQHGHIPLPPYIEHADDAYDADRYQTVYARNPGAVAAPTAGLHFDEKFLKALTDQGVAQAHVTLHVGAGTFQPVRSNDLENHIMHSEWYTVPHDTVLAIQKAKSHQGRVICVGTTSVRALESACQANQGELREHHGDTRLFIKPGYRWQTVDAMITNFHLPQSTLLMLVAAFIGMDTMKSAYNHAINERYKFFSYGDAMFLEKGLTNAV